MKAILSLLILFTFITCQTNKTKNIHSPTSFNYWYYRNFLDNENIIISENIINNLNPIHFNDLPKSINHKNNSHFDLKRKYIFNDDSDSDIRIQMHYIIKGANSQQFVGYVSKLENSFLEDIIIIFNAVDNKVKSIFVSHVSNYNGFGSENLETTYKGNNLYGLKVNGISDAGARFFEYKNCFTITDQGFIDTSVDCKNKKSIKRK